MQLLKPIQVTLNSNIDKNKELINEELIGQAVMGWIEMKQVQDPQTGENKLYPQVMFGVVWIGRTVHPAMSVYRNEELFSLGLAEEFVVDDESEDDYSDESYVDDENSDLSV